MVALRRAGILLHVNITAMEYNMDQMDPLMALVEDFAARELAPRAAEAEARSEFPRDLLRELGAGEWLI